VISWTTINPALITLFGTLAQNTSLVSDRPFAATWKEAPRPATHTVQKLTLLLKVTSCVGIGEDDLVYEEVPANSTDPLDAAYLGQMRAVLLGQRRFTLQVRAEVPEHTDVHWAMAATERIRTGLRRPSSIAALDDVDVALIRIEAANKVSFKDAGRVVSAAVMDVIFGTSATDIDPIPVGWIEKIAYSSEISDVDGALLPASLQVTDQEVDANQATPGAIQVSGSGLLQTNTGSGSIQVGL